MPLLTRQVSAENTRVKNEEGKETTLTYTLVVVEDPAWFTIQAFVILWPQAFIT